MGWVQMYANISFLIGLKLKNNYEKKIKDNLDIS